MSYFLLCFIAGSDYEAASSSLTFNAGQERQCVNVSIVDDGTNERREEFEVLMRVENEPSVNIAPNRAEVVIQDDDRKKQ